MKFDYIFTFSTRKKLILRFMMFQLSGRDLVDLAIFLFFLLNILLGYYILYFIFYDHFNYILLEYLMLEKETIL